MQDAANLDGHSTTNYPVELTGRRSPQPARKPVTNITQKGGPARIGVYNTLREISCRLNQRSQRILREGGDLPQDTLPC